MLSNAFALALLTTGAVLWIYRKFPHKLRSFIEEHSLLADIVALVLTYLLLGGTLTALVAGAMVGLMTSALLHIAANEQDFLFLYDLRDFLKDKAIVANQVLKDYGRVYREQREAKLAETSA